MPKCQIKGLTKRNDCETCPYLDWGDGYCEMLDRHIELPTLPREDGCVKNAGMDSMQ